MKLLPKLLTIDQMEHCVEMCMKLKNLVSNDTNFVESIVTSNETWVHGYDPEAKVKSSRWMTL